MDPFSPVLFNVWLWDVFSVSLFDWLLSDIFNPWGGNWWLLNEFNISVLNWRWLVDLDVLNLIRFWLDNFNDLLLSILDLIVFIENGLLDGLDNDWGSNGLEDNWCLLDDSVIIEWIVIIEVLV